MQLGIVGTAQPGSHCPPRQPLAHEAEFEPGIGGFNDPFIEYHGFFDAIAQPVAFTGSQVSGVVLLAARSARRGSERHPPTCGVC